MKFKLLALSVALGATVLTGCSTSSTATVSKSKYNSEIAKRDAELAKYRGQSYSNVGSSSATDGNLNSELFPPNAQPGHCYARLLTPATYETTTEEVLVHEASETVEVIPATYEMVEEQVLVREASTRVEAIPATFKTVTEQVLIKPASTKLVPYDAVYGETTEEVLVQEASTKLVAVPATYSEVTEEILDKPAHTVWKRGQGFKNSAVQTSYDQSTGEIMCLVEVPATYKKVTRTVLKTAATTEVVEIPAVYKTVTRATTVTPAGFQEVTIPAEYETVTKTVIDQPASTTEVAIPAEYKTVTVQKVVTSASENRIAIPAKYGTIEKRSKVTEDKLVWGEILCRDNINVKLIKELQETLAQADFYKGPIDGIYGSLTRNALNKFSATNSVAKSGTYIPLETVKLLGVDL